MRVKQAQTTTKIPYLQDRSWMLQLLSTCLLTNHPLQSSFTMCKCLSCNSSFLVEYGEFTRRINEDVQYHVARDNRCQVQERNSNIDLDTLSFNHYIVLYLKYYYLKSCAVLQCKYICWHPSVHCISIYIKIMTVCSTRWPRRLCCYISHCVNSQKISKFVKKQKDADVIGFLWKYLSDEAL